MYLLIFLILVLFLIICAFSKKENFIANDKMDYLYSNNYNKMNRSSKEYHKDKCKYFKKINLENVAYFWKKSGGDKKDCPAALIIASKNYDKNKKEFNSKNIDIGGIWSQGFYNLTPRSFGYCTDIDNKKNYCCDAEFVQKSLSKPLKKYGNSYTCYNAPSKIPKGFVGEGNNNFIGKFCHVGGENFYKDKQTDIKYGGKFQWSGGNCYKGCEYSNNSLCNKICKDKYPFPYYYYNKFLDMFDVKEGNKNKMEEKSLKIAKNICDKEYK